MVALQIRFLRLIIATIFLFAINETISGWQPVPLFPELEPLGQVQTDLAPESDEEILLKAGIERTEKGFTTYFQSLLPSNQTEEKIKQLIVKLGDRRFSVREKATIQLLQLQKLPSELILRQLESANEEVRWRLELVLANWRKAGDKTLNSALKYVAKKQVKGLLQSLSNVHAQCQSKGLSHLFQRALFQTSTKEDADALLKMTRGTNLELRRFSMECLFEQAPDKAIGELKKWMLREAEPERMLAVDLLARTADRDVLLPLVELLRSDSANIRARAAIILKSMTKEKLHFVAHEPAAKRNESVELWSRWVEKNKDSVKLVKWKPGAHQFDRGINIVASYSEGKVYVFDRDWKAIRVLSAVGPWDAQILENGNFLIACYDGNAVVEYSPTGKEISRIQCAAPWSAQRLANGRTLVATGHSAIEYDASGKKVWSSPKFQGLSAAVRLPNGNTLVAQYSPGLVAEITPEGKRILQIEGLTMPYMLQALPNGNILFPDKTANRILEYDRRGNVVWRKEGLSSPDSCQRLPNGNLVVTESRKLTEYDADGKVVFTRAFESTQLKFRRY